MPRAIPHDRAAFLGTLRDRHARHVTERSYEEMMYHARDPPTAHALADIVRFTRSDRTGAASPAVPDHPASLDALGTLAARMQWPDPSPLVAAADHLPRWDTLHVSTFLHTMIPDYPIWGPEETHGLARLGIDVAYSADATAAGSAYGEYLQAVKQLREAARFEDVPESHHYLTRIVQSALKELGET